jgi:hypothetical protein
MEQTIVGLFDALLAAQSAVTDLVQAGIPRERISFVANDASNQYSRYLTNPDEDAVDGGEGAGFGAIIGALTGIMTGLVTLAIPGIGPVLVAGPLMAAAGGLVGGAIGATAGAVTGGIVASLIKTGVPEAAAPLYAEGVRRGGILVLAHVDDEQTAQKAQNIIAQHGAIDIQQRRATWEYSGWTDFDAQAKVSAADDQDWRTATRPSMHADEIRESLARANRGEYNPEPSEFLENTTEWDNFNIDFQSHYQNHYNDKGYSYNFYSPAYRYGYNLGTDNRFSTGDWDTVESQARRYWEQQNPNNPWDEFKDAVHYAWDKVRSSRYAQSGSA